LVLGKRGLLVFCEVKTRTGADLGGPYEAVTWQKQARLRRLAEAFLAANPTRAEQRFRFDVASVTVSRRGQQQVYFFEDAF
ncbi:MAG: YraN family protein, partial [Candidatus Methylomirabilales bacterium]